MAPDNGVWKWSVWFGILKGLQKKVEAKGSISVADKQREANTSVGGKRRTAALVWAGWWLRHRAILHELMGLSSAAFAAQDIPLAKQKRSMAQSKSHYSVLICWNISVWQLRRKKRSRKIYCRLHQIPVTLLIVSPFKNNSPSAGFRFFWSAHKSFPWWWVMLFHLSPLLGESCLCARPAPAAVGIRRDWTKGSRRSLALHHRSLSCFVSFYGSKKKNHTINDMPTRDSLYYPPSGIAMKLQNQPSTIFDWWPLKAG